METSGRSKEFFAEFVWAIPKAFRVPLATCRFEQGDILYNTPLAYEGSWAEALKHIKLSIQVKSPTRGPVSKTEEDTDSMFSNNWTQPVSLNLTDHAYNTTRTIETTQGRLYTTLWRGDLEQLEGHSPAPSIPELPRDIIKKKLLPAVASHCIGRYAEGLEHPCIFIMPFDETSNILRTKFSKVRIALFNQLDLKIILVSPTAAGLASINDFVPTMKLALFLMNGVDSERAFLLLKDALYVPSKDKKTDKDHFRLGSHGYLYPERLTANN
jgi:hypothetical protein